MAALHVRLGRSRLRVTGCPTLCVPLSERISATRVACDGQPFETRPALFAAVALRLSHHLATLADFRDSMIRLF